jgi:Flp pilus assembly protein TadG
MTTERIFVNDGFTYSIVMRYTRAISRVNTIAGSATKRLRASCAGRDEGSALIEMAVVLPLVMLVMTGIFSFSLLLFQQIQLTETVSNAGHYLAVARQAPDPCATAYGAINGAPGVGANLNVVISQNGTQLPTSCPYNTSNNTSTLIQGATANVAVTSKTGLALFGTSYSVLYLGSQISEIIQ